MPAIRVLLVEDNPDNFELVRFLLDRSGYEVLGSHNGIQALEVARQERPDLILMDLSLPEMDGWTAARELKKDERTCHIPLLAVTGHTLPGDRKQAIDSGFDGYICKPINLESFSAEVAAALARSKPDAAA